MALSPFSRSMILLCTFVPRASTAEHKLSDGQLHTRGQMLYQLAQHFGISEEETQQMSGNQFTLVSRVAWCDVHFCKAGFVEKLQHHSASTQDEFRITTLGVREFNRRPEKLSSTLHVGKDMPERNCPTRNRLSSHLSFCPTSEKSVLPQKHREWSRFFVCKVELSSTLHIYTA